MRDDGGGYGGKTQALVGDASLFSRDLFFAELDAIDAIFGGSGCKLNCRHRVWKLFASRAGRHGAVGAHGMYFHCVHGSLRDLLFALLR